MCGKQFAGCPARGNNVQLLAIYLQHAKVLLGEGQSLLTDVLIAVGLQSNGFAGTLISGRGWGIAAARVGVVGINRAVGVGAVKTVVDRAAAATAAAGGQAKGGDGDGQ